MCALVAVAAASIFAGLIFGSADLGVGSIANLLLGADTPGTEQIVFQLRLHRVLAAFAVGALLALAGVLMQVLLKNPLADPYVLGTSGGAAVAALTITLFGLPGLWVDAGAFAGALLATLLVFFVARDRRGFESGRLLLAGIVLASGFAAAISIMLALAPERGVKGMLFWLMGDFSFARNIGGLWLVLLLAGLLAVSFARDLNVLARGETQARILGQNTNRVQWALFIAGALLTAIAVSTAGPVGFVGLVIPHLMRLVIGSDHRGVVPAAMLAGGALLALADTLARTIVAPIQLPVGALMALIGVPTFLYLLRRDSSRQRY